MHLFLVLLHHSPPSILFSFCFWLSLSLCLLSLSQSVFLCLLPLGSDCLSQCLRLSLSVCLCLLLLGSVCLCLCLRLSLSVFASCPWDLSVSVSSTVAVLSLAPGICLSLCLRLSLSVCLCFLPLGSVCLCAFVCRCLSVSCPWDLAGSVSAAIFLCLTY